MTKERLFGVFRRVPVMHRMQPRAFDLYHRLFFPSMDGLPRRRCGSGLRRSFLLLRYRLESEVGLVALFYPSVVALFTCLLWLIFFR
jgi:hypothetical protein